MSSLRKLTEGLFGESAKNLTKEEIIRLNQFRSDRSIAAFLTEERSRTPPKQPCDKASEAKKALYRGISASSLFGGTSQRQLIMHKDFAAPQILSPYNDCSGEPPKNRKNSTDAFLETRPRTLRR